MTEEELVQLIYAPDPKKLLDKLAAMPEPARQAIGAEAHRLYATTDRSQFHPQQGKTTRAPMIDALCIAVIGTATLPQVRKMKFFPKMASDDLSLTQVLRTLTGHDQQSIRAVDYHQILHT